MSARDRYDITLTCEACGKEGQGRASEADQPYGGPDFTVNRLPEGFHWVKRDQIPNRNEFQCSCGGLANLS